MHVMIVGFEVQKAIWEQDLAKADDESYGGANYSKKWLFSRHVGRLSSDLSNRCP